MKHTHYSVLGLPSTATGPEIRAAYLRQLERVQSGELPPAMQPQIEAAYSTLDNPSSRIHYDLRLAEPPRFRPSARVLPRWRSSLSLIAMTALAMSAAGLVLSVSLISAGRHRTAGSTLVASSRASQASSELTVDMSRQVDGSPGPAQDATEQSEDVPESSPAGPRPAMPQTPANASQHRTPGIDTASGSSPASPVLTSTGPVPEAQSAPTAANTGPQIVSAQASPPMVLSALYGGKSRVAFRVAGHFCRDTTGGQVFVTTGAPASADLSC